MSVNGVVVNSQGQLPVQQPAPKTGKLVTLPQGVHGQIFKFLPFEEVCRGKRSCKALKRSCEAWTGTEAAGTGFRLWEQRTGNVDAHHLVRYLKRRRAAGGELDLEKGNIQADVIQELRRIGERIQTLGLYGYAIGDLLYLFPKPRAEDEPACFPHAHRLELDLGFSRSMDAGWRPPRRRGARGPGAPAESYEDVRIFNMIRALASHCPQLQEVSLKGVSEKNGFQLLEELFKRTLHLTALNFVGHSHADGAAVARLCRGLKVLRVLRDPRIGVSLCDWKNIQSLFGVAQLRQLKASGVDDAAMAKIPEGHGLEAIEIYGPTLTNQGLENITRLQRLQSVQITNSPNITDLSCLGKLRDLSSVYLQAWYQDSFPLLRTLAEHGNIRELRLESCCGLTDAAFAEIGRCARLRLLNVQDIRRKTADIGKPRPTTTDQALCSLSRCQELEHLTFELDDASNYHSSFSTGGMIDLALSLPKLTTLNLQKCRQKGLVVAEVERELNARGSKIFVMRSEKDEGKSTH